jgi:hypothetical protein
MLSDAKRSHIDCLRWIMCVNFLQDTISTKSKRIF